MSDLPLFDKSTQYGTYEIGSRSTNIADFALEERESEFRPCRNFAEKALALFMVFKAEYCFVDDLLSLSLFESHLLQSLRGILEFCL
jgi:hypothetical protein